MRSSTQTHPQPIPALSPARAAACAAFALCRDTLFEPCALRALLRSWSGAGAVPRAFPWSSGGNPGGFGYLRFELCMLVCGGQAGKAAARSGEVAIAFLCDRC